MERDQYRSWINFAIDLFNYNRPKDFNINAAISDKEEDS